MIKFGAPALKSRVRVAERVAIPEVTLKDFKFTPEEGYLYTVARAISSRVNANYDGWPVHEIKKSYQTFIGRPIYVEHNNWDHKAARGVILDAIYKEQKLGSGITDASVYCLMEMDARTYPKLAKAIMSGKINGVSMGADVDATICSVCGNKAKDSSEYCGHIPYLKGQKVEHYKSGKRVEALVWENCVNPNFFELSYVFDPADESAWLLDKKQY